jgi:multidrug efflux pump subunit AcrA (membrane-fusion protein)
MRKKISKFILPLFAVGMLVFAIIHVVKAQQTPPKPDPPVEPARTPFGKTVAGAGIVEARSENINLGTAISGVVLEVYGPTDKGLPVWSALIGERVKKGQPLFRVDDRALKATLAYQRANEASAQAQVDKLLKQPRPEEVPPSEAKVAFAKANLELQEDQARRASRMIGTRAISEEDYRQRTLTMIMARRQAEQAKAEDALLKAGAWKPDVTIAKKAVAMARAQVKQTETELERAIVRAPVDGVVLQVNVRPGEYVATPSSQALMVLGEVSRWVHVRVDVDEHDIPRFKTGAPARASLRGRTDISYPLKFVRVEPYVVPKKSLTGENTERVDTRVLQVIYALDVTDKPVYVGQQMDVFIDVGK